MRTRLILIAAAVAVFAAAAGAETTSTVTVTLKTRNVSGRSGVATVSEASGKTVVTITMRGTSRFKGRSELAHLHRVTCAQFAHIPSSQQAASLETQLFNVVRNRSRTEMYVPLSLLTDGKHSIQVHEQNPPWTAVACGDIPKR
jgi:hypothetical protein